MTRLPTDRVMEETAVLIIGAGPSGLALGALLARMDIKVGEPDSPPSSRTGVYNRATTGSDPRERSRSV